MAPVTPPAWMQAGEYSARLDRQTLAGLLVPEPGRGPLGVRPGVVVSQASTALRVRQRTTPDMAVTVEAGTVFVPAVTSLGGVYQCHNDGAYNVTIAPAHATLNRLDVIIARVYDAIDDVGVENKFVIESVTGTPASAPVRPDLPQQCWALAELSVTAAATAITNAMITDLRRYTVALGGVLPINDVFDMPADPYTGMKVWRKDLRSELVFDGTNWMELPYGGWTFYTPSWSCESGSQPSVGNGTATGRYFRIGTMVLFVAEVQAGSTTTYGSGNYQLSLPLPPRLGHPGQIAQSRLTDASSGQAYLGQAYLGSQNPRLTAQGSSDLDTVTPTSPFTFANGDSLELFGFYEVA